jgi:Kef-type K+ transport system membrane component KefB
MHVLDESHILIFLLQVSILLALARTLGVICEEFKVPALAGEIIAGVLLGPTVFGRFAPDIQKMLFPHESIQNTMLETVSWLGVFFLLLASGFHVNIREAFRGGYAAISVGIIGVIIPILIGV